MLTVHFLGVSRRVGKSEKTGNSYDICELHYARPIKPKTTSAYQFTGHGMNERTLPCNPAAMDAFVKVATGTEVKLNLDPQPDNPERNWVVGIAK